MVQRAARLLSIAASTPGFLLTYGWTSVPDGSALVWNLAFAAYRAAPCRHVGNERFAAAEAMLRTGWLP